MNNPKTPAEMLEQVGHEVTDQESALFSALMSSKVPTTPQTREELLAIREREIMQNRLAVSIATRKPLKKLTFSERLKLRLEINRQLPEKK